MKIPPLAKVQGGPQSTPSLTVKKNPSIPGLYDVELQHGEHLKGYSVLECHISLYPYSRKIHSQNITVEPFEEYVKDIVSHGRSAYTKINTYFHKVFGLLLAFVIALVFFAVNPAILFSIESVVSVLGAYFVGKELWDDIERALVDCSKRWRVRYVEPSYLYQLEKHTTLTHYSHLAKKHRYGKAPLLPEKIDFIQQSNSQTVRMYFDLKDIAAVESAHMLSIRVDPPLQEDFEREGFMFGVKLSFNTKSFCIMRCFELFQSIDKDVIGCLDEQGEWVEGAFYRATVVVGNVKYFKDEGVLPDRVIVQWQG